MMWQRAYSETPAKRRELALAYKDRSRAMKRYFAVLYPSHRFGYALDSVDWGTPGAGFFTLSQSEERPEL